MNDIIGFHPALLLLLPYFPDYKSHPSISRTPYFGLKFEKNYYISRNGVLVAPSFCVCVYIGCLQMMKGSAKEPRDAINEKIEVTSSPTAYYQ